jgi:hypothetical protein
MLFRGEIDHKFKEIKKEKSGEIFSAFLFMLISFFFFINFFNFHASCECGAV